ncbi:MAG: hypothetical protein M3Q88_07165 [Pseudomonadota bacterium]|nr:hypothetical protein [Pseudomonadota bacterium]
MRYLGFIGLVLATATPAAAQEAATERSFAWRINDKAAPPDPSLISKNGFGLQIMITGDYEGFLKAWEGPTPPMLSVTNRTERGKPVNAMLIFSGCKASTDGNCNLTAIFNISGPDGAPYGKPQRGTVWSRPPAPGYALQLSEGGIGMVIEPGELLGRYTLGATVTDHVADITVAVEAPIEVVEAGTLPVR